MNKVKITSSNNNHFVKDGVLFTKPAGATPLVGKDNKMFLVYDLGVKLTIPVGVIALVLPPNESSRYSVYQSGGFVLLPGQHDKVTIEYKINTDAVPRVFEQEEVCAQIVFITTTDVEFENIIEEAPAQIAIPENATPMVQEPVHNGYVDSRGVDEAMAAEVEYDKKLAMTNVA